MKTVLKSRWFEGLLVILPALALFIASCTDVHGPNIRASLLTDPPTGYGLKVQVASGGWFRLHSWNDLITMYKPSDCPDTTQWCVKIHVDDSLPNNATFWIPESQLLWDSTGMKGPHLCVSPAWRNCQGNSEAKVAFRFQARREPGVNPPVDWWWLYDFDFYRPSEINLEAGYALIRQHGFDQPNLADSLCPNPYRSCQAWTLVADTEGAIRYTPPPFPVSPTTPTASSTPLYFKVTWTQNGQNDSTEVWVTYNGIPKKVATTNTTATTYYYPWQGGGQYYARLRHRLIGRESVWTSFSNTITH